jgi:hypothetical protein
MCSFANLVDSLILWGLIFFKYNKPTNEILITCIQYTCLRKNKYELILTRSIAYK